MLPEAVPQTQVPEDPGETMRKLRAMIDGGLIDQGQYEAKKAEVMGRILKGGYGIRLRRV